MTSQLSFGPGAGISAWPPRKRALVGWRWGAAEPQRRNVHGNVGVRLRLTANLRRIARTLHFGMQVIRFP